MNEQTKTHVWKKLEIELEAADSYDNPYADVDVWVELKGPDFARRCYGFWDGGGTWRVRVTATAPGTWRWESGSEPPDPGLAGRRGSFVASEWTNAEKKENPCRRGFICPTENGHAWQHADGTPFFLLADTWWGAGTYRFPWGEEAGAGQMSFQEAVAFRRRQGYNGVAVIAAFPHWADDAEPAGIQTEEDLCLRAAWPQPGTGSAQDMHDEDGNRPFRFPGKVPGYEQVVPDLDRPNPPYFRALDRKIDYLNAHGFVPFVEVARRDIGHAWKEYHEWPESYARYIHYVWRRLQANNCLLSPIHFDWTGCTIEPADWNEAANLAVERYGHPPFGQPVGTNSAGSSLVLWGHTDKARWLSFHQIGNWREHKNYELLTEQFHEEPPVPCLNGEPYYDGGEWGQTAPAGTQRAALYCRSGMYGSFLSGGLAGHIYGAEGLWQGAVEQEAEVTTREAIRFESGAQMEHFREFIFSEGDRYQGLEPDVDCLEPHNSGDPDGYTGWAYCARTAERDLFLLYFEQGCPRARLGGLLPANEYSAEWFNPRQGTWQPAGTVTPGPDGETDLPLFPGGDKAAEDWALKLTL